MIQDIAPRKFHNEYRPNACPADDSPVLSFKGKDLLVRVNGDKIEFPKACCFDKKNLVYAFAVDDTEYFLVRIGQSVVIDGFDYLNVRAFRQFAGNEYGLIAFTGTHLHQWYSENIFCGKCASPTVHSETERALHCPCCGRNIYSHIMPAVIVGVINGDKLLLTKYSTGFKYYALVAGFTEIGETLEETVAREVMEETGLKVKNIRYYKSQPWGIVKDLLAGFYCDVDGDTTIKMDENELKLAEWKSRDEIELQPDSYSLTNEMMLMFKEGRV